MCPAWYRGIPAEPIEALAPRKAGDYSARSALLEGSDDACVVARAYHGHLESVKHAGGKVGEEVEGIEGINPLATVAAYNPRRFVSAGSPMEFIAEGCGVDGQPRRRRAAQRVEIDIVDSWRWRGTDAISVTHAVIPECQIVDSGSGDIDNESSMLPCGDSTELTTARNPIVPFHQIRCRHVNGGRNQIGKERAHHKVHPVKVTHPVVEPIKLENILPRCLEIDRAIGIRR